MALGITNSIASNGETAITANLPMGSYKHTSVADAALRNQYASAGQVQDSTLQWGSTAGGTADALTLTLSPIPTAYVAGQRFQFISGASPNATATPTLAVNGLAAKTIVNRDGSALAVGGIAASTSYAAVYDGVNLRISPLGQPLTGKDTTGGYAGLTLYKINFKNAANTFTNFLTNTTTAARIYTFQDRDGTIADLGGGVYTGDVSMPSQNGGPLAGLRNAVINGGCRVAQRGGVAAINNAWVYGGCDRIAFGPSGFTTLSGTIQQYPGLATQSGFAQGASITTTGSGTVSFQSRIESLNSAIYNNKTVTFSATVFQDTGVSQTANLQIGKANSADTFSLQTTLLLGGSVAIPSGTPTKLSVTLALGATGASNGLAVTAQFTGVGAVTANDFWVGDWQLESGSVATPFEQRPIGMELLLCQRYYAKSYDYSTNPGAATQASCIDAYVMDSGTLNRVMPISNRLPVEMRVAPTIGTYGADGTNGAISLYNNSAILLLVSSLSSSSPKTTCTYITTSSNAAVGTCYVYHYTASAEL